MIINDRLMIDLCDHAHDARMRMITRIMRMRAHQSSSFIHARTPMISKPSTMHAHTMVVICQAMC